MALGSTQPLTEMSTRSIKGGRCVRLTTYHHPVPLSRDLGTLTSWKTLGHFRPVTGLFYVFYCILYIPRCSHFYSRKLAHISRNTKFYSNEFSSVYIYIYILFRVSSPEKRLPDSEPLQTNVQHSDNFFLLSLQCKYGLVRRHDWAGKYPHDQMSGSRT